MEYYLERNLCTVFGLGHISKMGTLGSLVGLIIGIILLNFLSIIQYYIIFSILLIISFYCVYRYQILVGKNDKSEIIIDEVLGQLLVIGFVNLNFIELILSFILFRFFDILKFFPVNIVDRKYSNYFGVIFDDIVAGLQSIIIILMLRELYDKFF